MELINDEQANDGLKHRIVGFLFVPITTLLVNLPGSFLLFLVLSCVSRLISSADLHSSSF